MEEESAEASTPWLKQQRIIFAYDAAVFLLDIFHTNTKRASESIKIKH